MRLDRLAAELHCNPEYTTKVYDNHSCVFAHLCILSQDKPTFRPIFRTMWTLFRTRWTQYSTKS